NLGRFADARRYFVQNRDIAVALNWTDADYVGQADAWIFHTDLRARKIALDDAAAARLEAVGGDAGYPDILRIYDLQLAAGYLEGKGDREKALALRRQALAVSTSGFSARHPLTFNIRLGIANAEAATDPGASLAEFSSLSSDMLLWIVREIGTAGDRDVA